MKRYLFYLGHPAHFHLFKYTIKELQSKSYPVEIVIKKKDVLENLVQTQGWDYKNIYPKDRNENKFAILLSLIKKDWELFKIVNQFNPALMIGTSSEITHIGKIMNIPSVVVNEDDAEAVPLFAKLSYPFATNILVPSNCSVGRWRKKTIFYEGYHELAYLHPKRIQLDEYKKEDNKKLFFLRFAKLTAHHDEGKTGITDQLALELINKLKQHGNVYISSERELSKELNTYRTNLPPSEILSFLSSSDLYIGDSQTMTAEAAVLGIPSIRFNDFVGKLGYLEELEYKYGLTYGIKTSEPEKLFQKLDELLSFPNLKEVWQKRRLKMLSDKIDVTSFMLWLIENYPDSIRMMNANPDHQYRFK
ncbi:MAG: DUF354 domain-containing protein [Ignavibacteriaceae bacterium]